MDLKVVYPEKKKKKKIKLSRVQTTHGHDYKMNALSKFKRIFQETIWHISLLDKSSMFAILDSQNENAELYYLLMWALVPMTIFEAAKEFR